MPPPQHHIVNSKRSSPLLGAHIYRSTSRRERTSRGSSFLGDFLGVAVGDSGGGGDLFPGSGASLRGMGKEHSASPFECRGAASFDAKGSNFTKGASQRCRIVKASQAQLCAHHSPYCPRFPLGLRHKPYSSSLRKPYSHRRRRSSRHYRCRQTLNSNTISTSAAIPNMTDANLNSSRQVRHQDDHVPPTPFGVLYHGLHRNAR